MFIKTFDKKEFFLFFINCRRGMLELDIILLNFLEIKYYDMDLFFKNNFYIFLLESDVNLYLWLVKKEKCNNVFFIPIINDIIYISIMTDFF